jgi:multicomponent Na+:H+ antiporter subunit A
VAAAASAVRAQPTEIKLALWHGLNPVLALSVLTVVVGAAIYIGRDALYRAFARFAPWVISILRHAGHWGPQRGYDLALRGLNSLASGQTRILQSGYLRHYLIITILTTVGLASFSLVTRGGVTWSPSET